MKEKIAEYVKALLKEGRIEGFLGLKEQGGHIFPYLFTKEEELSDLSLGDRHKAGDARYPLAKVLIHLAQAHPEATLAVMVRGCEERSLTELFKWNQLSPERVIPVGLACSKDLAEACACRKPYPESLVAGEKIEGVPKSPGVESIEALSESERFQFWMHQFDKCLKCYGCRNVCPMCFCKECSLEEAELVEKAKLPTENPIFHLTRAVHMIGRCIDCGLCEEACPADIPLRTLYKKVAEIIASDTGYIPGDKPDEKCPFNLYGGS